MSHHIFQVLLLDQGKCLFFGKTDEALEYFDSIGFRKPETRSVPEFLCSISEPEAFETVVKQGWSEKAPKTLDGLQRCFEQCSIGKENESVEPMNQSTFRCKESDEGRMEEKEIHQLYQRSCLQSLTSQVKFLISRQVCLLLF